MSACTERNSLINSLYSTEALVTGWYGIGGGHRSTITVDLTTNWGLFRCLGCFCRFWWRLLTVDGPVDEVKQGMTQGCVWRALPPISVESRCINSLGKKRQNTQMRRWIQNRFPDAIHGQHSNLILLSNINASHFLNCITFQQSIW